VPAQGPLARLLLGLGMLVAGTLIVAGGIALRGPGLVAVVLAGALVGCTAAGIARESPQRRGRSTIETAAQASAWTVGVLLAVAGLAVFGGGVVTALVVTVCALVGAGVLVTKNRRRGSQPSPTRSSGSVRPGPAPLLVPVSALSTAALGREWLRTTEALAGQLDPEARRSIVHRREEALDELERRDPAGFAQWLAAGPLPGSDPAGYVGGGPVADSDAA
jgi:hypothetical protein